MPSGKSWISVDRCYDLKALLDLVKANTSDSMLLLCSVSALLNRRCIIFYAAAVTLLAALLVPMMNSQQQRLERIDNFWYSQLLETKYGDADVERLEKKIKSATRRNDVEKIARLKAEMAVVKQAIMNTQPSFLKSFCWRLTSGTNDPRRMSEFYSQRPWSVAIKP